MIHSLLLFPIHFTSSDKGRDIGEERKEEEVHLTANVVREGARIAMHHKSLGLITAPIFRSFWNCLAPQTRISELHCTKGVPSGHAGLSSGNLILVNSAWETSLRSQKVIFETACKITKFLE